MSWFDVVRPARTVAALAAALLVAACGGGGSGDGKDSQVDATPQSASVGLSGVASKGLLKNAVVKVYALNPDGSVGALLATTRTDSTGHYQISGLSPSTLAYVEVSADGDTRMADEATGVDLTPSIGFKLRAVQALSSQGATTLQVTPFSDMAVVIALANGGFKPEVVDAANQRIVSYFSYDVLTNAPTFDSANRPTNPTALNLAAVSALAKNDVFADCTGKSDVAKIECVVAELKTKGVGDDDVASKLESAKADLVYAGNVAVPHVQPQHLPLAVGAVKSGIAEAKDLIKNVRSNADKSVTDALAQRFQAVSDQFNAALVPFDDKGQHQVLTIVQAAAVLDNPVRELGSAFKGTFGGLDVACTLYNADSTTPATSYTEAKSVTCIVQEGSDYTGSSSSTYGAYSYSQNIRTHEIKISKTATVGSYAVQSALYEQDVVHHVTYPTQVYNPMTFSYDWVGTYSQWDDVGSKTALSDIKTAALTLSPPLAGSLYGAMTLKGNLAPSPNNALKLDDHVRIDLAMTSVAVGDLTRVNVQGNADAVIGSKTSSQMLINEGSYLQLRTVTPGDVGAALAEDQAGAAVHIILSSALTSGASLIGTLEVDLSGYGLNKKTGRGKVTFDGELFQTTDVLLFKGTIAVSAPKDIVLAQQQIPIVANGSIDVDGTLPLPSRPDMVVHLTTTTDRSALHSFSGSYIQAGFANVLINGSIDESTGSLVSLTLSTPSGVTVTVHPDDTTFNIMKGTDVLGVFTASNGRILYADNTYEQY